MRHIRTVIVILILSALSINAQSADIVIKYIVEKDSTLHLKSNVSDYFLAIVNNNWDATDLDSRKEIPCVKHIVFKSDRQEIVVMSYKINRTGAYFIKDFFGHEVFLDPSMEKDTIVLILKRRTKTGINSTFLNDSVKNTKYYTITYPPKYKYMGFCDSIAYLHGDLRGLGGGYSFKELNNDQPKYLAMVNKVYEDRLKFLKDFTKKYFMPAKIQYYAFKEIQYCYYNDLLDPLLETDANLFRSYPKMMRDSVNNIGADLNNDDLFENTSYYRAVTLGFVSLGIQDGKLQSLRDELDSAYFVNRIDYCKKKLKGKNQAYALTWFMEAASEKDQKRSFALLYKNYDRSNSTPGLNSMVDSLYKTVNHTVPLTPEEILGLTFENKAHQGKRLSTEFNKDLILIDCWATWCIPCRQQMPALDSLAEEYKDRVQFISLSADQFSNKWDDWLLKSPNPSKNILQLHAVNGFEHYFFKRMSIKTIPRYILVSRSGKILNADMPFPSEKDDFKKELKKYL